MAKPAFGVKTRWVLGSLFVVAGVAAFRPEAGPLNLLILYLFGGLLLLSAFSFKTLNDGKVDGADITNILSGVTGVLLLIGGFYAYQGNALPDMISLGASIALIATGALIAFRGN